MENESNEPQQQPRIAPPCSTPHSAPVAWLRGPPEQSRGAGAEQEGDPDPLDSDVAAATPPLTPELLDQLAAAALHHPDALADAIAHAAPDHVRHDGWTPFSRRLFLQVLAESGRVTRACAFTGLSRQSAYALRTRDALFGAGWDAACELARPSLADALYEQAIDGVTDTIEKDGKVVASRHRHDSRLSIAVLHRLDKRCDRAEEHGARHLAVVRAWEEWLGLIGRGEDEAARALLERGAGETAPHCQPCQLPLGENPTGADNDDDSEPEGLDLSDRCWKDGVEDMWLTDFPPPPGFTGYESRPFEEDEDDEESYQRACTEEEVAILDADAAAARAIDRAEDESLRDAWFDLLKAELPEPASPPAQAGAQGAAKRRSRKSRA